MSVARESLLTISTDAAAYELNGTLVAEPRSFAGSGCTGLLRAGRNVIRPVQVPCRYAAACSRLPCQACRFEAYMSDGIAFGEYWRGLPVCPLGGHAGEDGTGPDTDVVIARFELTRLCPITLRPIRYPGKGLGCSHPQVPAPLSSLPSFFWPPLPRRTAPQLFDLLDWLRLCTATNEYKCPLCKYPALHQALLLTFALLASNTLRLDEMCAFL